MVPNISEYAHVHGQHDCMKRPFTPLGCSVMAHVKPRNRCTWDVHGKVGLNIGTLMKHHWCFNVYIVKTRATRVSNSDFFKHQYITNPHITPETLVIKAAVELTSALKGTVLQDVEMAEALAKFSDLFCKIAAAQRRTGQKQKSNGTIIVLTQILIERSQFQVWTTNHLPNKPYPLQGCRKLQQLMIVAYWEVVAD